MVLHHPQEAQRPHTQGDGRQAPDHTDARVERQRQGAAAEKPGGQQPRQTHVARGPGCQPYGEHEQDEARADPERAQPLGLRVRGGQRSESQRLSEHGRARHHFQGEESLLEHGHTGNRLSETVDSKEERQRIGRDHQTGRDRRPYQPDDRHEHQHLG